MKSCQSCKWFEAFGCTSKYRCSGQSGWEKARPDGTLTDEEIYRKITTLHDDEETFGCWMKGHCDLEQWKRVAVDWLKTECEMETPIKYQEASKGYFKVIPPHSMHFFEEPIRGGFPAMQMEYL